MYQDKIKKEASIALSHKEQYKCKNIFVKSGLAPLDFVPDEGVCDATHIARDILSKRSNEDVILLSKAIDSMLNIGENLLQSLSMKLLKNSKTRTSVVLTQGRELYLLCDYFELDTLDIKKIQWSELFGTLTLMQSAEIVYLSTKTYKQDDFSRKGQQISQQHFIKELDAIQQSQKHCINELKEEIIDSIARAECFYDNKSKTLKIAKSGGKAKAKITEPLKIAVISRYSKGYSDLNPKQAGKKIFEELSLEKSPHLLLSYNQDKPLQFSTWIREFERGKYKLPLNI
ncbi:hypothetical protein [Thalassotalea castellviae]|uniref:Uncharacterized protein n=1 Tax=Thalassotalea castellviae TaxID=3075612 RepID=A0ABU3A7G5_9GAMM|nr:hypothetical protein [Thalassotalea sp. W431]MDT0605038.1 hypothetical protein [Thalassotalea sp. W431]